MSRFIDDILRYGFINPRTLLPKPEGSAFMDEDYLPWTRLDHRRLLSGVIVIDVDDVAALTSFGPDDRSFHVRDFPCVVPPFDSCFVEFKTSGIETYRAHGWNAVGALVLRLPDRERAALAILFLSRFGRIEMCNAGQWEWDEQGCIIPPFVHLAPWEGNELESTEGEFLNQEFAIMLTAFSLLSCKNVRLMDALIPIKLNKAHTKRCGIPLVRYKVLDVMPMRKAMKEAGGKPTGDAVIRALHICRGHFKDYREHGLFGRNQGMFWWQPHVRGSALSGCVVKDYRIRRP